MSYVKNYDVGQINVDLLNSIGFDEPPFVQYTHELPLLSFGDVQHNLNLSLVFNYERYRDDKANSKNPFFIAPGFKLNLHKRLTINQNSVPTVFQGEDGRNIDITSFGSTFTFDDESQRIIRRTEQKQIPSLGGNTLPDADTIIYNYTVEHSDFSKEIYNESGRISSAYDKYGNVVLSYTYNTSGQLESVTFRGSKTVTFGYVSNRLDSITYNNKTTKFVYNSDGTLNCVQHYTGVKYTFTLSKPDFSDFEVDFECKASATEGTATVSYSKKLELVGDSDNEVYNINIVDKNGSDTVNTVTYRYPHSLMYEDPSKYVDIIDNNGVETRVQIHNNKILCSYEVQNGEPPFEVKSTDANSRYLGNVMLYNGTVASLNSRDSGVQKINDGQLMNYYTYDNSHCWSSDIVDADERNGYYTISGWIKSNVDYVRSEIIYIGNTFATNNSYEIPLESNKKWHYFSITVSIKANTVYVRTAESTQNVSLRDVRLTYQRPDDLSKGNLHNTAMSDYVLLNGSNEIAFNDVKFYYSVNSTDHLIENVDGETNVVTFSDVMRYKLRKKRESASGEVYYNNCKDIVVGATNFKALVDEETNEYISINNLDIGIRVCSKGQKTLIKYSIDENNQSSNIVKTCTVKKQSGETTTSTGVVSTETLDTNLDVISSTVENVTTQYVRNSQGLVTKQSVSGLYRHDTTYTDTLITVNDVDPGTDSIIATTKYYIDSIWGGITKIEMPDGSVTTDTYDGDMSFLTGRTFGNATTHQHAFEYSKGRLSSITSGAINYDFGYATNTGDIASITKNDEGVEQHTYNRSNGETTVNSNYPSSDSALHSETKVIDKYGRLKSINGILENSYCFYPKWFYLDNASIAHTIMDGYDRSVHGDLEYSATSDLDYGDSLLSQTTDSLAGEVTKYGYDNGKPTAAVTRDMSNSLRRQETFVYDSADRITRDCFDHDLTTNEYVTSDIGYVKAASDPTADSRVSNYSYKVNGTEKAKTVNTYDTYKRIKKKTYTVGGKTCTKEITYDNTKVNKVVDSVGGTTQYEYDSMGRISKEMDGNENILRSYTYDSYGQLIRENNKTLDKTFVFEYNNIGNVVSVKTYSYTTGTLGSAISQQSFGYNTTYPDRLTSFGGTSISYNAMGCPATVNGYTATWTRGKLSKLTSGSRLTGTQTYDYTYNAFGQRIRTNYTYVAGTSSSSAVVLGMLTGYSLTFCYDQSGRLICESKISQYYGEGSGTEKKVYLYDENGVIGMVYTSESGTTTTYYFQRNLLGDVIGIYDTSGTKVGGYAYDAWGNCTITLNTNGIASRNPIRYRGYYYDEDTKLYYLNARYYCPEWRRFISPDATAYLNPEKSSGLNLYVYCHNDPVNYVDPNGRSAIVTLLITAAISAAVAAGSNALGQVVFDGATWDSIDWRKVAIAGISGFASGLIPGSGFASIAAQSIVASFVENGLNAIWLGEDFDLGAVVKDTIVSIGTSYAIKGLTHLTSKLTSKIFNKAPNYSQYQHYYRSKGYDYSRQTIYDIIEKHQTGKSVTDSVIENAFDFLFSFLTYPV